MLTQHALPHVAEVALVEPKVGCGASQRNNPIPRPAGRDWLDGRVQALHYPLAVCQHSVLSTLIAAEVRPPWRVEQSGVVLCELEIGTAEQIDELVLLGTSASDRRLKQFTLLGERAGAERIGPADLFDLVTERALDVDGVERLIQQASGRGGIRGVD